MRIIRGRTFYKEPWYGTYRAMMDRCYREKAKNYPYYGGRGIKVCEEWHNIEAFERWALSSGYEKGLTLDREDVNGDYCPENCRWKTNKEQANNRRNTIVIEGRSVSEWADILGINRSTITTRYYRGLPIEKVLSTEDMRCHG